MNCRPEALICKLCLDVMRNPVVVSPCRDVFCEDCLERLRQAGWKLCPVCRREMNGVVEPAIFLKSSLSEMRREPPGQVGIVHGDAVTPEAILRFQVQRTKQFKPKEPSNSDRKIELKLEPDESFVGRPPLEMPYARLPETLDVGFLIRALPDIVAFAPSNVYVVDSFGERHILPEDMLLKDIAGFWSDDSEYVLHYSLNPS